MDYPGVLSSWVLEVIIDNNFTASKLPPAPQTLFNLRFLLHRRSAAESPGRGKLLHDSCSSTFRKAVAPIATGARRHILAAHLTLLESLHPYALGITPDLGKHKPRLKAATDRGRSATRTRHILPDLSYRKARKLLRHTTDKVCDPVLCQATRSIGRERWCREWG